MRVNRKNALLIKKKHTNNLKASGDIVYYQNLFAQKSSHNAIFVKTFISTTQYLKYEHH